MSSPAIKDVVLLSKSAECLTKLGSPSHMLVPVYLTYCSMCDDQQFSRNGDFTLKTALQIVL